MSRIYERNPKSIIGKANEQDELNALRERMHTLELEHAELCNEMEELRAEMRRMSYRFE